MPFTAKKSAVGSPVPKRQLSILDKVLIEIADNLEKRTARQLSLAVRLLEPIMLLVMAGAVLVVVIALLMPVIKMSSAI